jgi:hypothetical protein
MVTSLGTVVDTGGFGDAKEHGEGNLGTQRNLGTLVDTGDSGDAKEPRDSGGPKEPRYPGGHGGRWVYAVNSRISGS